MANLDQIFMTRLSNLLLPATFRKVPDGVPFPWQQLCTSDRIRKALTANRHVCRFLFESVWRLLDLTEKSVLVFLLPAIDFDPTDIVTSWLATETGDVPYVLKTSRWLLDTARTAPPLQPAPGKLNSCNFPSYCLAVNLWSKVVLSWARVQSTLTSYQQLLRHVATGCVRGIELFQKAVFVYKNETM